MKATLRRVYHTLTGKYKHIDRHLHWSKATPVWYGNQYGGFYVLPELMPQGSAVYSFGVGEDISFDRAVIEQHGCEVHAFDPTPRSLDWSARQSLPAGFTHHPYGIGKESGTVTFRLPVNEAHVSGSMIAHGSVTDERAVDVEMRAFRDILTHLGHTHLALLKLDIEGSEYDVLPGILATPGVAINQIAVEIHERFFDDGKARTVRLLEQLDHHDYALIGISDSHEELTFARKLLLNH